MYKFPYLDNKKRVFLWSPMTMIVCRNTDTAPPTSRGKQQRQRWCCLIWYVRPLCRGPINIWEQYVMLSTITSICCLNSTQIRKQLPLRQRPLTIALLKCPLTIVLWQCPSHYVLPRELKSIDDKAIIIYKLNLWRQRCESMAVTGAKKAVIDKL